MWLPVDNGQTYKYAINRILVYMVPEWNFEIYNLLKKKTEIIINLIDIVTLR